MHTPGEWTVGGMDGCLVSGPNKRTTIGRSSVATTNVAARTDAENQANAKLIASAPDLLEAAKYALLALTDASEIDSDRRGAIAQLRAALQKAE